MARKVEIEIIGDASRLGRAFRQARGDAATFGNTMGRLGSTIRTVGKAAAYTAGAAGLAGLFAVVHQGTAELKEQQQVQAQTAAAIRSTGRAANVSQKHIEGLALRISNLSGVGDEAIQTGANMLLSFTKIQNHVGRGNKIFDRATKSIVNFAVRTGRDPAKAAVLLGRALEDPAKKLSALSRAGIIFSEAQKKMVARLVETGHFMEAQKVVLRELERRYGGAAAAAGRTLPGMLSILRERFRDLSAEMLNFALPTATKAIAGLTGFVRKLSDAKGFRAKLNVVWSGLESMAERLFNGLRSAIGKIDWSRLLDDVRDQIGNVKAKINVVWTNLSSMARRLGNGLQRELEQTDWAAVGSSIGEGVSTAVERAIPAAKELGSRMTKALREIDWEQLGRSMGPGLAAAVTTGFLALLDPAFWARNWDLALSVAIIALGGPIGRVAGRLAVPFTRLGGRLMQALGLGLIDRFPKLATALLDELPKAFSAAFRRIHRVFDFFLGSLTERLGEFLKKHRVISFVLKVTGLFAAIQVLRDFFGRARTIMEDLFGWMKRRALKAALSVIEPFSHIPRSGGDWARDLKTKIQGQLGEIEAKTRSTARNVQRAIDGIHGKNVEIGITYKVKTSGSHALIPDVDEQPGPPSSTKKKVGAKIDPASQKIIDTLREQNAILEARVDSLEDEAEASKKTTDESKKKTKAETEGSKKAREAAEAARDAYARAREQASQLFGQLFRGPTLSSPGVETALNFGGKLDPKMVLDDMRRQNQESAALIADLATIQKRGAPKGLLEELRSLGPQGAPIADAIARATKPVFNAIVGAFRRRQEQLKQAVVQIQAKTVVVKGPVTGVTRPGFATGGTVPGSGSRDTVPAMLTPGEIVLNRRQQAGLGSALGMPGAGPHQLFGAIQHFALGGVVDRFKKWAKGDPWGVKSMRSLYGYLNHQSSDFLHSIIPTPAGIKAMGLFAKDIGLGYLAPRQWQDRDAQARARAATVAMVTQFVRALRDPVNNAGFLAGMLVPLPTGKVKPLTMAERRAEAAQAVARATGRFEGLRAFMGARPNVKASPISIGAKIAGERPFSKAVAARHAADILSSTKKSALPPGIRNQNQLVQLMHELYESAIRGRAGKLWYEQSGKEILAYTRGNKAEAEKIAQLVGIYSARQMVGADLAQAVKAYEMFKRRGFVKGVATGDKDAKAMSVMRGEPWGGRKTNNFYLDLMRVIDPAKQRSRTSRSATMDIWMRRAFRYRKAKRGEEPISNEMYDFMEMVNESVAAQLGWKPHQAQAAIWTDTKARIEGTSIGQAALDYSDYLRTMKTALNYEAAHGRLGDDIQDVLGEAAARRYAREKFAVIGDGADLASELGLLARVSQRQQGVSEGRVRPGMRDNLLTVRPKSLKKGTPAPHELADFVQEAVEELAAARGYALRQWGVGYMTWWSARTKMGGLASKLQARRNAFYLTEELPNSVLKKLNRELGDDILILPTEGGYILKSVDEKMPLKALQAKIGKAVERLPGSGGLHFEPVIAHTGLVTEGDYARLLRRADRRAPGFRSRVDLQRRSGDAIDASYKKQVLAARTLAGSAQSGPLYVGRHAAGGVIDGSGSSDSVPALLTPGEIVLNRRQQAGLARVLGLGRVGPQRLFGELERFGSGGVVITRSRPEARSFIAGGQPSSSGPSKEIHQHNTITVPPHFADTQWAVERGLEKATWRLRKGV